MKKLILTIWAAAFLSSCATNHPQYNQQQFSNESYQKNVVNAIEYADNFVDFDQRNIPKATLDTRDFSILLDADIAFNQGNYAKAADSYYYLANKYQDPRIVYKGVICYEHTSANLVQYAKLNELVNLLIKIAPDSNVAKLFGVRVSLENNDIEVAKQDLKAVIQADPSKSRAILLFLSTVISNDVSNNAKANLEQFAQYVAKRYKNYPEGALLAVVSYSITANESGVLTSLANINQKYPTWEVPVYWSAGILSKQDNIPLLLAVMQQEISLVPQPSDTLQNLYIAALIRGDRLQVAKEYIQKQLILNPGNNNLLIDAAIIDYKLSQNQSSIQNLTQAQANQYFLDGAVDLALGALYDIENANESAILNYQHATQLNPILVPAANLGILRSYLKTKNTLAAGQFVDKVTKANKLSDRDAEAFKISLLIELGNYELAYKAVSQDIRKYWNDKNFVYFYASLSGITGRMKQAISWYQKYIKLNPGDSAGYNDLGFLLADKTTRYKEAYILAKKAYALAPKDPAVLDTIGWVCYKLHDYTNGQNYLESAYKLTQDHNTAMHLKQIYLAQGKTDLADKVIVISPQVEQMQFAQTMLNQAMLILMYYQYGLDLSK